MTRAVLGIDIGGTKISLTAADESGQALFSARIPTRSGEGAPAVLDRLASAACDLLERVRSDGGTEVSAIGVVTPGVVSADSVRLAPNNEGWEKVALTHTIREQVGLGLVEADNDAKAATLAEARWGALAGVPDGVLLNLGTGISAGAITGGSLLRGAHGAALEIAYQVPSRGPAAGFADGRAPLEETFSGGGLEVSASALLGRRTGTEEVFAAMAKADHGTHDDETDALAALGREALDLAARSVANLAIALDPEVIAVSGGMLRSAEQILPRLEESLSRLVPFPPRLVLAHFGSQAPLAGACLLAFRTAGLPVPGELRLDPDTSRVRTGSCGPREGER